MDLAYLHNWAVKLLEEKGHQVADVDGMRETAVVDGKQISFPVMYEIAGQYPEWTGYRRQYLEYLDQQSVGKRG
jgi:hypothetical protein